MKTTDRLFVDIHILQTVPPSCVNRDDTGSPKTAVYGGATRARVSSQCWKHAVREYFLECIPPEKLGKRTKRVVELIAEEMRRLDPSVDAEEAEKLVRNALDAVGLSIKPDEKSTKTLLFISAAQAGELAALLVREERLRKGNPSKKIIEEIIEEILEKKPSIDIALFGRMVADNASLNIDACAQVAHSISTHRVANEYDYFTAVDDLSPKENAGAGHVGGVEFNSSTLYRYATVAVHKLYKTIPEDMVDAVCEFIRAFVYSMPTGKLNSFANRTLPDAVLVTLRADQPINLVGAFERPVQSDGGGYVAESARRLAAHAKSVYRTYGGEPLMSLTNSELLSELAPVATTGEMIDRVAEVLKSRFGSEGGDL